MAVSELSTETVWSRLSADLWRFIRRRVQDDHAADDLLQETFVRIHRSLGTLADSDNVVSWVYRIARNLVNDHHRARKPIGVCQLEFLAANADSSESFQSKAAIWMDELIQQLPERYRSAVRMSEVDGLAQRVVAERLGLSISGAKSRIQRGRVLLKDVLEKCCTFHRDRRGNVVNCDPKADRTVCQDCDL